MKKQWSQLLTFEESVNLHIQEAQWTPEGKSEIRTRHWMVTLPTDKECLASSRREVTHHVQGVLSKINRILTRVVKTLKEIKLVNQKFCI